MRYLQSVLATETGALCSLSVATPQDLFLDTASSLIGVFAFVQNSAVLEVEVTCIERVAPADKELSFVLSFCKLCQ